MYMSIIVCFFSHKYRYIVEQSFVTLKKNRTFQRGGCQSFIIENFAATSLIIKLTNISNIDTPMGKCPWLLFLLGLFFFGKTYNFRLWLFIFLGINVLCAIFWPLMKTCYVINRCLKFLPFGSSRLIPPDLGGVGNIFPLATFRHLLIDLHDCVFLRSTSSEKCNNYKVDRKDQHCTGKTDKHLQQKSTT